MALLSALFLFATAPDAGAIAETRATARIVAAEEVDFSHWEALPTRTTHRLTEQERRAVAAERGDVLRLTEFY